MNENYYPPIGYIKNCFKEKFGVPRQSSMVPESKSILKLNNIPEYRQALNHLEDFSHLWVIFVFHKHIDMKWKPIIHPPREDAPKNIGVFASRSPHRPNPIGMSAVKLDSINWNAEGGIEIHISNIDLLDGTPVIDIKPYIPYTDRIMDSHGGWADKDIPQYPVVFSIESDEKISRVPKNIHPNFKKLLFEILRWDPRPTSQKSAFPILDPKCQGQIYAFRFLDFDIKWQIDNQSILVLDLIHLV